MRKLFFTLIIVLLPGAGIFSSDFSVSLNINYNAGTTGFFQESSQQLSSNGLNFIEKKHNQMGVGFNFGFYFPIIKRFYIVPGVSMYFGHQQYEYTQVDGTDNTGSNDVKDTYYFQIYSGELNLLYDLLVLDNGWYVDLLLGINYNYFKADAEMMVDNEKYLGLQTGVGARFFQLRHLGFQFFGYYKVPFSDERLAYMGVHTGLSYRF